MSDQKLLRNIAIIAHVDHGKTTLVDGLLKQSGLFRDNQTVETCVMDSNDLERERGITILAKNCSLMYHGVKINVIDTPGHADFGGEVERVLKMADGVLLLVDAFDGPMPQTRFVLKKALGHHLKPILVVNKIDRPEARPRQVVDEVLDLFIDLGADEDQLDFPIVYASGRQGVATLDMDVTPVNLEPLFQTILEKVPPPSGSATEPLQMLVSNIDYSSYTGRIAIGRVFNGAIRSGQQVALLRHDGSRMTGKVVKMEHFTGLGKQEIQNASAGDIVAVTGLEDVHIGETIADVEKGTAMEYVSVDEPTISMNFIVNSSPFAGAEGKFVTSRLLSERLDRELKSNVALRVDKTAATDTFCISGRGLLHLSILIENMRREGFELAVSKPQVILKEIDGQTCEPVEWVVVDCPDEYTGKVIELLGMRKGGMESIATRGNLSHLEFKCPSRGLIGLRNRLLNATRGTAVLNHVFHEYEPYKGEIPHRSRGVIVASDPGVATTYALINLQDRGTFFVNPGDEVYVGMVVGEHCHESDIEVNIAKAKHLTNMRASSKEATVKLQGMRSMSLEEALEYIEDDELVEVTPKSIRLRKICLDAKERKRRDRDSKNAAVGA